MVHLTAGQLHSILMAAAMPVTTVTTGRPFHHFLIQVRPFLSLVDMLHPTAPRSESVLALEFNSTVGTCQRSHPKAVRLH